MSDETNTTSEVARVLREHFDPTGTERNDPYAAAVYEEAAQALAEAGLLREEHSNELAWNRGYTWGHNDSQNETETRNPYRPQIAAQEPAGATQGGSGDSRASGGLGERLRALGTGQTRTLRKVLRAMADEADRLEEALRSTTHQLELEQDDVCVAHGTVRPCRHCAYAAAASEGTW